MYYVITYVNITEEKCYYYIIVILNIDSDLRRDEDETPREIFVCVIQTMST